MTFATFQDFSPKVGIGITYEYLLGRNFGFGGVLAGGPDYAEFSGAILGLMALGDNGQNVWTILLLPFIFENPCIHFEPTRNSGLGLSFHFMKFRYIYERNNSFYEPHDTFASGSVTFTLTVFGEKNWQWSFYAEGTALYYPGNPKGIQVGIALKYLTQ